MERGRKSPSSNPYYETDHIYLAAYLLLQGHQVETTKAGVEGRVVFCFPASPALHQDCAQFFSDNGQVGAREYVSCLLKIKRMIPRLKRTTG